MKKQWICLLLALCLCLSACAETKEDFSSGSVQEGLAYTASGISPDATAMTVDGRSVRADVYFYWLAYDAASIESYMAYLGKELDWDEQFTETETVREYVLADALNAMKYFCAIETLAEQNDIALGEEWEQTRASLREQNIEAIGSEEGYLQEIDLMTLREEGWDVVCAVQYLYEVLSDASENATKGSAFYTTDEELEDYIAQQGYVTADHILFLTMDMSTYTAYDDDTVAAQYARAQDTLALLEAYDGDDLAGYFAQLADLCSEDTGRYYNPDGYTFTTDEMVQQFEDTAFALEEGAFSGIVETSYGYHIILRKPLDLDAAKTAAQESCRQQKLENMISSIAESSVVEMNPAVESLDIAAFYSAVKDAQEAYYAESEDVVS